MSGLQESKSESISYFYGTEMDCKILKLKKKITLKKIRKF